MENYMKFRFPMAAVFTAFVLVFSMNLNAYADYYAYYIHTDYPMFGPYNLNTGEELTHMDGIAGSDLLGVALSPDSSKLYLTGPSDDSLIVIDTATDGIVKNYIIGNGPAGIVVEPISGYLYVACLFEDRVYALRTSDYSIVSTIFVGDTPFGIAANGITGSVYVTNANDDTVSVINSSTNTVVSTINVGQEPMAIAANTSGTRVYVCNQTDDTVSVINTSTNTVVKTITISKNVGGIVVHPSDSYIYVATDDAIEVISAASNTVVDTIGSLNPNPLDAVMDYTAIDVHPNGTALYATARRLYPRQMVDMDEAGDSLYKISLSGTGDAVEVVDSQSFESMPLGKFITDDITKGTGGDVKLEAVINTVEAGKINALWYKGGEDTTARGDRVTWGYFYANPSEVSWGSQNNPEVFVKVWYDAWGRIDANFFHVSVPDIEVSATYNGNDLKATATTSKRYIRLYFNDSSYNGTDENSEDGIAAAGYSPAHNPYSYSTINGLKIGATINTVETAGAIDGVWKSGGQDNTSSGNQVIWGYFYANPSYVSWGNQNNPELFVKIWFDANGRIDVNYFHVSVPDIEVYSDYVSDGIYDKKGTTIINDRYIRHEYYR